MKIIVTGGAGFIGSALVWRLNQLGYNNIIIVDRLDESEKWKNLVPLKFEDYVDADDFIDEMGEHDEFDVIFHLGACSSTTEKDSGFLMHNNVEYTKIVASWAAMNGIRCIYASSAATYGNGSAGMKDGASDLNPLRPLNMYGFSKHLVDKWAQRMGLFRQIVGLKYFNVFGPNENHKGDMRSLVSKAVDEITSTGSLNLFRSHNPEYKDGEFGRDFLYVKDAVDMTIHFMDNDVGGLFNVGSGQASTWNELANATFAALGREPKIEYIDMPEQLRGKYQYHTQADLTRIRKAGYSRTITPLAEAVADYVQNYLVPDKHLGD
jgi:ADP-L-glycero-D-manno-heptose 6-epimerase